jgi:uncharacterized membrane protein
VDHSGGGGKDAVTRLRVGSRLRLDSRLRLSWGPNWPRYSLAGTVGALVFGCASFTPSLLPRDWWLQALVAGLSGGFGYAVGVFAAWIGRSVIARTPSPAVMRRLWLGFAAVAAPLVAVTLWLGQNWQDELHRLMGEPPPDSYAWVRILFLSTGIVVFGIAVVRALRWLDHLVTRRLARHFPQRLARPMAVVLIGAMLVTVNDGLIWRIIVESANSTFRLTNTSTDPGVVRPADPGRSGSPASLVPWQTLGRQGRDFVSGGPTRTELAAFGGRLTRSPVRVYAGLDSAPTTHQRAALAVRELRRAGGFDRSVLVVVTTTGTGQVEADNVDAIELMYRGDTAIVAMQYSYLPSWISFLGDHEKAQAAGRELFDQVYDAWAALPVGRRPKLLVSGTSLGAFGAEAAFSGLEDIRHRTDGVVWAGPPNASTLHTEFRAQRDAGSPEWRPVLDHGRYVRFAGVSADLANPTSSIRPSVVYLQNGSDPIVFWSPRLLFDRPDWLGEKQARDVSPAMFWIPVVTFWQVTADLPFALKAPAGHGHNYREMFADAWAAVAPPPGWTAADTTRLRVALAAGTSS